MIFVVVGPTASGKSDFALNLALKHNAEIINADSRQIYKELNIGTAKPSSSEFSKCPHHLFDCASIQEPWNAVKYASEAKKIIQNILDKNKPCVVVGGTGLYLKALFEGLDDIPKVDNEIKNQLLLRLETEGLAALYSELQAVDADAAQKINSADTQRILRALEVKLSTGKSILSFWENKKEALFKNVRWLGLSPDRSELYKKIDARVLDMMTQGLKNEAFELIKKFGVENPVLTKTIGYSEWIKMGFDDDKKTVELIQKNTRNFAKRQLTWFRANSLIEWNVDALTDVFDDWNSDEDSIYDSM